jgi:hypothetical protein
MWIAGARHTALDMYKYFTDQFKVRIGFPRIYREWIVIV